MFDKILNEIVPTQEDREKAEKIINEFLELLNKKLKEYYNAKSILGGSFAKDTWLKNDFDVDIFVLFDKEYKDKNISDLLEKIIKELNLCYQRVHASRDYFKVKYKGFCFELVPVIEIEDPSERTHIMDVSPLHVKYVLEKIKQNPNLKNEIRLAKYFLKKWNVYGAETSVRGFSGYAVELLVIYYKSFENWLKNVINWRPKVFIDIEKYYTSKKEAIKKLGKDKTRSPLILIDPVDPLRNAAASLSVEAFGKFVFFSKLLLENKKFEQRIDFEEFIDENMFYLKIFGTVQIEKDICNKIHEISIVKLQKLKEFFEKQLVHYGFEVFLSNYSLKENSFQIDILGYPKELPRYEIREGPLLWDTTNVEKFYEKWKPFVFIKGSRIYAIVERRYKNIYDVLEKIKNQYSKLFKDKYKVIEIDFEIK